MSNHTKAPSFVLPIIILVVAAIMALSSLAYALSTIGDATVTLSACETEDQTTDCYWDADTMGNGQGEDFIVLDGEVYTH